MPSPRSVGFMKCLLLSAEPRSIARDLAKSSGEGEDDGFPARASSHFRVDHSALFACSSCVASPQHDIAPPQCSTLTIFVFSYSTTSYPPSGLGTAIRESQGWAV